MTADRLQLGLPQASFVILLAAVYATAVLIASADPFARSPDLAAALAFDLTVLVPGAFYLLVVRTTPLPGITVLPVFLLSLLGASLVIPAEHQAALRVAKYLVLPVEVLLAGYVAVRAVRAGRGGDRSPAAVGGDLLERLHSRVSRVVPVRAAAGAAAHEIAVLYYALFSWRARPDIGNGDLAFSYHRRSGYTGLLGAAGLAGIVEMLGIHLLVHRWSATLAWVLTAVSAYGLVWLLAHFQAVRLRPVLLTHDALHVRIGLLWSVRVPFGRIDAVGPAGRNAPEAGAIGYLHAVPLGNPQLLIELRDPVDAHGPYGYTRRAVRRIGISVDQRDRFAEELRARLDQAA